MDDLYYLEDTVNGYKFYLLEKQPDGTYNATYGRIGSSGSTANYTRAKAATKLKEKLRKGYVDKTASYVASKPASRPSPAAAETKYRMTGTRKEVRGVYVYKIVCVQDFELPNGSVVEANDVGGWIEKPENLWQKGNCWVDGDAVVFGSGVVMDSGYITDNALCEGLISGAGSVYGNSFIAKTGKVSGTAVVSDDAIVEGKVGGNAVVAEKALITTDNILSDGYYYGIV